MMDINLEENKQQIKHQNKTTQHWTGNCDCDKTPNKNKTLKLKEQTQAQTRLTLDVNVAVVRCARHSLTAVAAAWLQRALACAAVLLRPISLRNVQLQQYRENLTI